MVKSLAIKNSRISAGPPLPASAISALILALFAATLPAQSFTVTNYTFDTAASAKPSAWASWPSGVDNYVTNGWSSFDVSNSPTSGSLVITSTFTAASQQSVVWNGKNGDYNPSLNGNQITNFSCFVKFDGSSPTNSTTQSFGSLAFYVYTQPSGGGLTQIGGYFHPPSNTTNWVSYSIPINAASTPALASIYAIAIQLETYGNALTGTSIMYVDDIVFTGGTVASNPPISGASIVDWNNVHQRIDGFGASSAWNGSWTPSEADLLFSTNKNVSYTDNTGNTTVNNGAGLSLLRSRIAPASTTSPGDLPGSVETYIMQLAQARGARVWSTPWSPAAGFKDSGVVDGGNYLGLGANPTNLAYASQLVNYIASMKNTYGINLYALSIQNEPDGNHPDPGGYESCLWSAQAFHDFTTNLYAAMVAGGFSSTLIMLPESQNWTDPAGLALTAMNDPAVAADVSIIANHDYVSDNGAGDKTVPAAISDYGKARWETEVALLSGNDSSMVNGIYVATRIHLFMTQAQANAYHYWWLVADGEGNEGLLDLNAAPTKRLFVFGQYSRFVRPNFNRINATSSSPTALISAYKDSVSPNFAIVAVNTNTATGIVETFTLTNFVAAQVTPWITSATMSLSNQTPLTVTGTSFSYTLPAMSVVTFVGAGIPGAPPVPAAVASQAMNPGVNLSLTNAATDPDVPPLSLTYTLASGPTNATLNSTNGLLAWRPLVSQAGTTNPVKVIVRDNGSPSLSGTNTFTLTVNPVAQPQFSSITAAGGQFNLLVNGAAGPDYTLLSSPDLITWNVLLTSNSPPMPASFVITNTGEPQQFYRIILGP